MEFPSFLTWAGHQLGGSESVALPTTCPNCVSAFASFSEARRFCGCLAVDGAEKNFDLSALGLLFPGARVAL